MFVSRFLLGLVALLPVVLWAHPIPELPVKSSFLAEGQATVRVEVDPRCFEANPDKAPYLLNSELTGMDEAKKAALMQQAGSKR